MAKKIKIASYVLLALIGIWCGINFVRAYSKAAPVRPVESSEPGETPAPKAADRSGMMTYAAGLFAVILGMGLLLAFDLSKFFAHRFEKLVFDDEGEAHRDPEYEEAEKVWANGQPLEAISLMREFLKAHPSEQYAALRIAEIYEKDLGNYLAAALEYEEILKKRLNPDRWGRAAIHLTNLYSKLNRPDDANALLRRIMNEHPQTTAAKKARETLGEAEPAPDTVQSQTPAAEPGNLPPGFRPK